MSTHDDPRRSERDFISPEQHAYLEGQADSEHHIQRLRKRVKELEAFLATWIEQHERVNWNRCIDCDTPQLCSVGHCVTANRNDSYLACAKNLLNKENQDEGRK